MGVYYKLVNVDRKERIEPGGIGLGGIKSGAIIFGASARLLAYLLIYHGPSWRLVADESDDNSYFESTDRGHANYCADMTEHYVAKFNEYAPAEHRIELYDDGTDKETR